MELGVHLPLMQFGDEPLSAQRIRAAVDAARGCGFAAVSANDHLVFQTPWLDGPAALASVIEPSGEMDLATTVALAVVRWPVPLALAVAAIIVLSEGRLIAGVGPGSSAADYAAQVPKPAQVEVRANHGPTDERGLTQAMRDSMARRAEA